jgi:uncharacterized protein YukE
MVVLALLALGVALPSATALAATGVPVNVSPPAISGITTDGNTLKVIKGTWSGLTPMVATYQWQRCDATGGGCSNIAGATTTAHKAVHEDVGHALRIVVKVTNTEGSGTATTGPTSAVGPKAPVKGKAPIISGLAQDGQVLTVGNGTWGGTPPFSYTYQWQSCVTKVCSNIAGANSSSYRATSSQLKQQLRAIVTAANPAGKASKPSGVSKKVIAGPPVNTEAPSIAGTPLDGQTLVASTGTWGGTGPFGYSYQWQSCPILTGECTDIAGATGSTYAVQPLDVSSNLKVVVTATNSLGSAAATSGPTGLVGALLPVNTELPTISGLLQDGQLLAATIGSWTGTGPISYGYQWQVCNAAGEACTDIAGAVESAIKLPASLVGSTLRVVVTATNPAGSVSTASAATGLVGALLPVNSVLPSISGLLQDGGLLSAVTGTWTGTPPFSYGYQWQVCNAAGEACKDIAGAVESALKLSPGLVGSTLRVVVTATNAAGSASATSGATSLVDALLPGNSVLPSISGVLEDGHLLSAVAGAWTGTAPISYGYQWQVCNAAGEACKDIAGAVESALTLSPTLVGSTLRVVVTATNAAGSTSATSDATSLVGSLLPSNSVLPSISGLLKDGQLLSAATGTWIGTPPISYGYQWQVCNAAGEACKDIAGAVESALKLSPSLVGSTLRVVVTATNAAGSTSATSSATGLVGALLPSNSALPSILGLLQDGQLLSALPGTWSGTPLISYAYQWQSCPILTGECTDIPGATSASYTAGPLDVGSALRVVVTATNSAGSVSTPSGLTGAIAALLPSNTSLPSISGLLQDGQLLSAATGTWTGTPPISYGYQWQVCNAAGEACKDIVGAVESALKLSPGLVGSTLRVVVTATNGAGSTSSTSSATSLVGALLPSNTALPSISGLLKDGQLLSAATGTWTGTPSISYGYQWQVCNAAGEACKDVVGAVESALKLSPGLVGSTLRVVVTATNAAGSTSASSTVTGLVAALLPSNTAVPTVSGLLKDGQLLSATTGSWSGTPSISYGYQWQVCNAAGEACKDIGGAVESALKLSPGLVGSTLRVVVTATNAAGSTSASSMVTGLVAALLPSNTALPNISGVLKDGQLLSSTTGTWTGTPSISYGYQWQACNVAGEACKDIGGAVESTLKLASGLVGSTVRVVVTATNSAGSTSTPSAASGLIAALLPSNSAVPTVSGLLKDGQLLSATTGTWSGTPSISYAYQWQVCNAAGEACKDIVGAVESALKLSSGLVGSTVRVVVTATNGAGSVSQPSAVTTLVAALLPSNTSLPVISGLLKDGQLLSASTGSWSGTTPITYGYQWQVCNVAGEACKDIVGAVESALKLSPGLVGSTVRVIVTATNGAGSVAATSAASGLIAALLPSNASLPTTSGTAQDGQLLSATTGTWSGTAPITYAYQWQSCNAAGEACKNVSEAVASTLKLAPLDVGTTLRVAVTATNSAGSTSATSAATAPVTAIPLVNTALPTITGILKLGQLLTAGTGTWTGTPPTFTYQWQSCSLLKTECKNIPGATKSTLTLEGLLNLTVKVIVTATNAAGSVPVSSGITGLIGL